MVENSLNLLSCAAVYLIYEFRRAGEKVQATQVWRLQKSPKKATNLLSVDLSISIYLRKLFYNFFCVYFLWNRIEENKMCLFAPLNNRNMSANLKKHSQQSATETEELRGGYLWQLKAPMNSVMRAILKHVHLQCWRWFRTLPNGMMARQLFTSECLECC